MRTLLLAAAIVGAASVNSATDAEAQYQPWCSVYTRGAGTNCGFYTYAQCLANVSGIGGWCIRNPHAAAGPVYGPGYYDHGSVPVRRKKRPPRRRD
jgi:hypothetical protein